ncbi:hypothetical protein [Sodalis sp. dw_96]|uniref:hypothetical protein n=1 Tax=Sodalis sp. dw_96 TaxID=2719794 RepID=UPI001BD35E10|nr:hypothetical protein [Sodalis sp. dw_96]
MDDLPESGYAVVRCVDKTVVATFADFPDCERSVMYRHGTGTSFLPLRQDEVIGTPSLFTKMLEKAGYKVT